MFAAETNKKKFTELNSFQAKNNIFHIMDQVKVESLSLNGGLLKITTKHIILEFKSCQIGYRY